MRLTAIIGFWILSGQIAVASNCDAMKSTMDLYLCALDKHPEYVTAKMTEKAAKAARDKVTRFPNPELSMTSTSGELAGENVGSTELALTLSLSDIAFKRPALHKAGKAAEALGKVQASEEAFRAKASLIKEIYRYRQVLDELVLVTEAIATFEKIERQFKSRRARGPEQQITLNLVELAQGDYQLKKNHLAVEKMEIEAKFHGMFGNGFKIDKKTLPIVKTKWPMIRDSDVSSETLQLRRLKAQKEMLEAENTIAFAEAWPEVSAGPVIERNTEGPVQYRTYGFNISVSLPIFSWNSGARGLAKQEMLKAQTQYEFALRKAEIDRQLLMQKYNSAVDSLKKATSLEDLNKKHLSIDRLFSQGLTSGGSVIEAHRQILEFAESQHEHEMMALETLMHIKFLSGAEVSGVLL